MNNTIKKFVVCAFALLFLQNNTQAQTHLRYLNYIFPADSIRGFDEAFYSQMAMANGYFGSEFKVFMYSNKRNFINQKYKIGPANPWLTAKPGPSQINSAPCVNEDFESSPIGIVSSTLAGWSIAEGQNMYLAPGGSCTMNGCCPTFPTNNAWVMATPIAGDPVIGTIPNSPLGGTKVLKLNDNITNKGEVVRIQQTFPVTSSNALFQFAYMAALNGTGHTCCSQPYVRFTMMDCMNNPIACPQVSITPPGPSCATVAATGWTTNTSGYSYTTNWMVSSLDLTPYMGSCVTVQITIGDCDGWAHFGYGYVDCLCKPMTITVNNIQFPAGSSAVAVAACGATTGTLVAPPGLGPYTWQGPAGSGITANPNQTITTTMAGNYTLTMNPLGVCAPITKTVQLTFGTFPTAGFTSANACTTYSFTNTGTGPPSYVTWTFAGPGAPASFTTTNATSAINFAPSTTYTIYQTVTNPAGCPATASMVITTPPGPTPAFTASPSFTQCFLGNTFTFNATTTAGTHTWTFNSPVGAPPTGSGSTYGPVAFTAAGTYTVTHTVNSGGCVSSTSSLVVVNVKPTAVASATPPACSGGPATFLGTGGPGTVSWAGPSGWIGVGGSASISSFSAANVGIYTLTVNNFGCITTQTISLSIPPQPTVTAAPTISVCLGQTINLNAILTSTSTTYAYWSGPGGFFWNQTAPTMTNATTTSSGVYYFYVGFTGGCWAQTQTTVSVIPTPTINATNTGPYCAGVPIVLNGFGPAGSTYTWTGPSTFSSNVQNPVGPTATVATAGTYSLTLAVGSCTVAKTTTVVVNPAPVPVVGSNSPVCLGNSILLTATGGTAYAWSGPSGYTSAVQNPTLTNATTLMGGVYTVTVTSATGCKGTGTVNVTITTPTTSAANTGPYCPGQTISLSTPAAATYTWTGPSAFASNAQNPTQAGATVAMAGVYTVTSTSVGGCKSTATTNVIVNPAPTPTATNTGPYCAGSTIQLNVGAFTTYTWSGPSAFASNAQNPTQSATIVNGGVYTVTVTNGTGCTNTSTTTVVVNPIPTPTAGSNSPVCLGNTINLTSGGATTYTWSGPSAFTSTTQNPNIPSATTAMGGVYTVTATSLGCSATATVNVTISSPTTSASNTGPYCAGATMQLNAPAATSYTWSGPSAFASNAQNPTQAGVTAATGGVYTISVTIGTCKATATTNVVVNALPTPTASNTGPYCVGQTIQLNTGAMTSYTWSGPSAFASNSQSPTQAGATAAMGGVYTVTVTDANGCKNNITTTVIVNPIPTPTVGSNSPVCINSSINLTASGGTGYVWSGPSGFTSAIQNPNVPSATAVNSGIYTVTVTSLGCSATGTVNVTVTTPTTSANNPGPFCVGTTMQLNSIAASSYTWSGPGGFASNLQNPTQGGATMAMAGTYSVIVSIGTCTAAATTTVAINALPTPTASNTGPYCPGNTIQLNTGAMTSYTWTGPAAFASNSQNPTQAGATTAMGGIYTITVTDANGCKNNVTTTVLVNPTPTPTVGSNSPVCIGNAINLTANGGTGYSWSGPNAFASAIQNPNIPAATTINAGVYTVTVTALGCTATGTVNVTVTTPTTSAGNPGPFCVGSTIQLNALAATTYTWSGPGGFASNLQNPTQGGATMAMAGTYSVNVSIGTCTAAATTTVAINALPTPTASNTGPYCPGNTIQLNTGAMTTYTWSGPAAFASNAQNPTQAGATAAMSGVYTVSVTDANGCKNNVTTNVVVNPQPTPVVGSNSPVCLNTSINLTANGGTGYAWSGPSGFTSALQNPNVPSATSANAGVYTVTVTALGCTNTGTVNVSVLTPVTTASNTGPFCAGATIQLNTPAATSYTWSGPAAFSSSLQNPTRPASTVAMGGVYTVIASVGTCTAAATTTVVVNALPVPVANSNSPVCVGQAINFAGSAATTFTWSGPSSFSSPLQNPSIPSAAATSAGVYTYSITDANGCKAGTTTNVVVNPLPVIAVNNPTSCVGSAINITSNGGATYAWSGPGGFTSALQNPIIPSAVASNAGAYTVTVTTAAGCSGTAVANIGVTALPTPAIASNTPCVGQTLSLGASGGTLYSWSGPNSFNSSSASPSLNNVTMPANGTYTLTATSGTCSASTTAVIVVNPLPNPNIVTNSPVCIGQSITITGSGGNTYAWTGPGGFTSTNSNINIPVSAMSSAGTYSLTVVDANGCVNSTNTSVVVNPLPNATATGGTACQNANTTLNANGGTSYSWTGPGGFTSNLQGPTLTGLTMANAGVYNVIVTSGAGCTNSASVSVVVYPAPTPNIITNSPVCLNNPLSFAGSGGLSYSWSGPMGPVSSAAAFTLSGTSITQSGNYVLTVTDANGCSASTSATAIVNPLPTAAIVSSPNKGCAPMCVTFTVTSNPPVSIANWIMGDGSYMNGPLTTDRCYQTAGIYTLSSTVVDVNGCQGTASYTVESYPKPTADFNYDPIKPIESVDMVSFTDASYGAPIANWNWYFMSNAQYTSNQQNPQFLYMDAGGYPISLIVTSDKGCKDTITISILVGEDFGIYVPNAFTPNEDGLNDTFYPKGFGIQTYEINIFDRWGERVFSSTDFNEAWDGTYINKGSERVIKDGVYTWQIKVVNVHGKSKELTGHVTLIK